MTAAQTNRSAEDARISAEGVSKKSVLRKRKKKIRKKNENRAGATHTDGREVICRHSQGQEGKREHRQLTLYKCKNALAQNFCDFRK